MSHKNAISLLSQLMAHFPEDGLRLSDMVIIPAADIPHRYRDLLVHNDHMTATLENHYNCQLALEICNVRQEGNNYSRKLLLHAGKGGLVVMVGIINIQLQFFGADIAGEIVAGKTPLGRILIENVVMRRIESLAYIRIKMNSCLHAMFEVDAHYNETFGRIARIICDHEPAVELLEIIPPNIL